VYNDLGSGSNVDLCIITQGGTEYLRNHEYLQAKTYQRQFPVVYGKGTTRGWRGRGAAALRGPLPCACGCACACKRPVLREPAALLLRTSATADHSAGRGGRSAAAAARKA
jgi:hypothetical protein